MRPYGTKPGFLCYQIWEETHRHQLHSEMLEVTYGAHEQIVKSSAEGLGHRDAVGRAWATQTLWGGNISATAASKPGGCGLRPVVEGYCCRRIHCRCLCRRHLQLLPCGDRKEACCWV